MAVRKSWKHMPGREWRHVSLHGSGAKRPRQTTIHSCPCSCTHATATGSAIQAVGWLAAPCTALHQGLGSRRQAQGAHPGAGAGAGQHALARLCKPWPGCSSSHAPQPQPRPCPRPCVPPPPPPARTTHPRSSPRVRVCAPLPPPVSPPRHVHAFRAGMTRPGPPLPALAISPLPPPPPRPPGRLWRQAGRQGGRLHRRQRPGGDARHDAPGFGLRFSRGRAAAHNDGGSW